MEIYLSLFALLEACEKWNVGNNMVRNPFHNYQLNALPWLDLMTIRKFLSLISKNKVWSNTFKLKKELEFFCLFICWISGGLY